MNPPSYSQVGRPRECEECHEGALCHAMEGFGKIPGKFYGAKPEWWSYRPLDEDSSTDGGLNTTVSGVELYQPCKPINGFSSARCLGGYDGSMGLTQSTACANGHYGPLCSLCMPFHVKGNLRPTVGVVGDIDCKAYIHPSSSDDKEDVGSGDFAASGESMLTTTAAVNSTVPEVCLQDLLPDYMSAPEAANGRTFNSIIEFLNVMRASSNNDGDGGRGCWLDEGGAGVEVDILYNNSMCLPCTRKAIDLVRGSGKDGGSGEEGSGDFMSNIIASMAGEEDNFFGIIPLEMKMYDPETHRVAYELHIFIAVCAAS